VGTWDEKSEPIFSITSDQIGLRREMIGELNARRNGAEEKACPVSTGTWCRKDRVARTPSRRGDTPVVSCKKALGRVLGAAIKADRARDPGPMPGRPLSREWRARCDVYVRNAGWRGGPCWIMSSRQARSVNRWPASPPPPQVALFDLVIRGRRQPVRDLWAPARHSSEGNQAQFFVRGRRQAGPPAAGFSNARPSPICVFDSDRAARPYGVVANDNWTPGEKKKSLCMSWGRRCRAQEGDCCAEQLSVGLPGHSSRYTRTARFYGKWILAVLRIPTKLPSASIRRWFGPCSSRAAARRPATIRKRKFEGAGDCDRDRGLLGKRTALANRNTARVVFFPGSGMDQAKYMILS